MNDLIARLRDARPGYEAAWSALFDAYYPKVLAAVRERMPRRAPCDDTDYANDVFHQLAAGEFDFATPEELEDHLMKLVGEVTR